MNSIETIVTFSNNSDELKNALTKINKELKEMKEKRTFDKDYNEYIRYSNLQRLRLIAIKNEEKSFKSHF